MAVVDISTATQQTITVDKLHLSNSKKIHFKTTLKFLPQWIQSKQLCVCAGFFVCMATEFYAGCLICVDLWLCFLVCAGKVLVHCTVGVSRSATLVLAYLMIRQNLTLVEAIKTVKDHRGVIPNRGFLRQLNGLDSILRESRKTSPQSWKYCQDTLHLR